jgi:hypothetical protein
MSEEGRLLPSEIHDPSIEDLIKAYVKREYVILNDGSYPEWQFVYSWAYFRCWWFNSRWFKWLHYLRN